MTKPRLTSIALGVSIVLAAAASNIVFGQTKIKHIDPIYPADAIAAGVQGDVTLEVTIGTDGHVYVTRVVKSIPKLDQAAVAAVSQWEYDPRTLRGALNTTVTIPFKLPAPGQTQPAAPSPASPFSPEMQKFLDKMAEDAKARKAQEASRPRPTAPPEPAFDRTAAGARPGVEPDVITVSNWAYMGEIAGIPQAQRPMLSRQLQDLRDRKQQIIACTYGPFDQQTRTGFVTHAFWYKSPPPDIESVLKSMSSSVAHPFNAIGTAALSSCPGTPQLALRAKSDAATARQAKSGAPSLSINDPASRAALLNRALIVRESWGFSGTTVVVTTSGFLTGKLSDEIAQARKTFWYCFAQGAACTKSRKDKDLLDYARGLMEKDFYSMLVSLDFSQFPQYQNKVDGGIVAACTDAFSKWSSEVLVGAGVQRRGFLLKYSDAEVRALASEIERAMPFYKIYQACRDEGEFRNRR